VPLPGALQLLKSFPCKLDDLTLVRALAEVRCEPPSCRSRRHDTSTDVVNGKPAPEPYQKARRC